MLKLEQQSNSRKSRTLTYILVLILSTNCFTKNDIRYSKAQGIYVENESKAKIILFSDGTIRFIYDPKKTLANLCGNGRTYNFEFTEDDDSLITHFSIYFVVASAKVGCYNLKINRIFDTIIWKTWFEEKELNFKKIK